MIFCAGEILLRLDLETESLCIELVFVPLLGAMSTGNRSKVIKAGSEVFKVGIVDFHLGVRSGVWSTLKR